MHPQPCEEIAPENALPFLEVAPSAEPGPELVRVLIVDDNSDDRALAARELRREIPNVFITEAANETAFEQAFAAGNYDAIITDYQLLWSNGLKLLERFKRRWPDVPVIMFTGSGSEEVAVQAMKTGVHDYVLKAPRHFGKLRTSVHMALQLRARNRALAEAERRYKMLFDTVPVGLFRCTPSGKILDANPALASILGIRDRKQLLEGSFSDWHPTPHEFLEWREKLEREGSVASVEGRFRTRGGAIRWVEIHARALRDPADGQVLYEGSVEDITERKLAEQEREKLIEKLQAALARVKSLSGLLPICASCKKIRDERGAWNMIETYIEQRSHAHFTHSFCPECARRLYPQIFADQPAK
jgi:PAS domain S-box-containing protein